MKDSSPSEDEIQATEKLISTLFASGDVVFNDSLSELEANYLYWIAKGRSAPEIRLMMKMSSQEVEAVYQSIKKKLACRTWAEAVFKGIQYGDYLRPLDIAI